MKRREAVARRETGGEEDAKEAANTKSAAKNTAAGSKAEEAG